MEMLQQNLMEHRRRKHLKVEQHVIFDSNAVDCALGAIKAEMDFQMGEHNCIVAYYTKRVKYLERNVCAVSM